MIMNIAVAVAVTELFVASREAGSHSLFWHNAEC